MIKSPQNPNPSQFLEASRLELLVSLGPAVIFSFIPKGDFPTTFVSNNIYNQFGYHPSEFINNPSFWDNNVHPEDYPDVVDELQALFEKGKCTQEYRFKNKEGEYRWIHAELLLTSDSDGGPVEVIGSWLDISERKKMEEMLRDSEARLVEAQRIANLGSWDWNILDGSSICSDEFYRIFGLEDKTFDGSYESFLSIVHPEDREQVDEAVKRALNEGIPFATDYRIVRPDGSVRYIYSQGNVDFGSQREPVRMAGTVLDITDRKEEEAKRLELEVQLRQKDKMEAVGTMAGGIAHDFNNLLAIIRGNLDLIETKKKNGRHFDKNLEYINQSTSRAIDLVRQILAFSHQKNTEHATIDLAIVIEGALRLLRSTIPSSVEITSAVANRTVLVNADATQVQQIIINLFTNALHAMGAKGLLTVNLHEVDLSAREIQTTNRQAGRYAKLTVTDTGSGMSKETIARIFEPFFTTKGVGEGTGMGLSVVYRIVDSHGGFITVDSTLGKGTSFNIYFPSINDRRQKVEETRSQALPYGTERVLLVDDEKDVASTYTELLECQGYKVTSSTSSIEALAIFKANPETFDLVFTDQTMPEKTGVELADELLNIRPNIPIILCSGYSDATTQKAAKSINIRKFCTKPLNKSQLALIVRKVLDDDGHLS